MNNFKYKKRYLSSSIAALILSTGQTVANEQNALSLDTEKTNFTVPAKNMRRSGKVLTLPLRIWGFNQGGYDARFEVIWKSSNTIQ